MSNKSFREAITYGLEEALESDENVLIMGEDIGAYGGAYSVTKGFIEKYGARRIKDTPISEAAFVGAGVGAASVGLRPIVELMSISFALVAFDQIVNMSANLRYMSGGQIEVPMVIRAPTGAGVQLGATHSQSFETWLAEVPGMKCVCPSNPSDALGLLRSAIADNNPVIFAEHAHLYNFRSEVPDDYFTVPIGKGRVTRGGEDVALVSYGYGVHIVEEAADILESEGISVEVVDMRSLHPIDFDTITASAKKTGKVLALDTARKTGGIMAEVVAELQQRAIDWLDAPVVRIGSKDVPWPYSRGLEQHALPDAGQVVEAVKAELLG